jgi:hypothetical protein
MMETVGFSETLVSLHQAIRRNITANGVWNTFVFEYVPKFISEHQRAVQNMPRSEESATRSNLDSQCKWIGRFYPKASVR